MKANKFIHVTAVFLMFLYLYAAISKLIDYNVFEAQIGKSPMITQFAGFLAWFIPAIEIVISVLLFIQPLRLAGFILSFTLMLGFTLYISIMLLFSPYIPCSCGGILSRMDWTTHLMFNILVTAANLIATLLQFRLDYEGKSSIQLYS